ncbi:HlyD family type I secretion periplasmic adaptor subunit [Microvirga arsenatis]|uniref:Membrane fusion protein (MFP) family protein n=1 Tax=Microvirga arsenatis TaxID=2692265 RepID=A0ABW9Z432_9HYPH|nr:HlyD family type I secretion periplasmic adaptor subunit [Microvirga arsenatis]NBJ11111.1 HlyD family type I secretion periplasmic adaptor subunit [Microvirga arsenatis]NBJ25384.1 HlyD family type I secretion periplasmic adaptor subunit [Microvirga arsenatis]
MSNPATPADLKSDTPVARPPVLPRASRLPRPDSHVLALEELRVHGLERALVLGTGLLVAGALTWAAMTHVPEVAIGVGDLAPAVAPAPVQHLEGGIVTEVLVAEGDMVEVGQPLLRIHDAATQSELSQARLRLESLQLQSQRLAAAADGNMVAMDLRGRRDSGRITLADAGGETQSLPSPVKGVFAAPQRAALDSRLRAMADRVAVLQEQVAQRRSELTTLSGQIAALHEQMTLHAKELGIREELARGGLTTRLAVLEAQRLFMSTKAEHERLSNQYATAQRSLAEAEARIVEIQSAAVDDARQEAARVALEIAETAEVVRKLEDRAERTMVRAPIAGVLRGLAVHRPGTVVPPGGLVAEIMPQDAPLVANVRLLPRDIGFIKAGQPVQVKVQAFDYARFGSVEGTVERVSAGTFLDEQKQPHYRARVVLSQQHVGPNPQHAQLVPGMTVQADITTGNKTVLQYLLKPIYSAMAASFHER